nr:hypothetical protein [Chromatium okenii]
MINIFTPSASIRANEPDEGQLLPAAYLGLDRYEARKRIVADLDAAGLLAASKTIACNSHAATVRARD